MTRVHALAALALALVLAPQVALVSAQGRSAKVTDKTIKDLEAWVIKEGGMIKTYVGKNAAGYRGLFAGAALKQNEYLATIPSATIINTGSMSGNFMAPIMRLLTELKSPCSRFKPYFAVMPKPNEVSNACNIKEDYWHLMHSDYWYNFYKSWQDYLRMALDGKVHEHMEWTIKESVGNVNVTYEDLQYACALTSTRYVSTEKRKRLIMAPVYDMMNHRRDCEHYISSYDNSDELHIVAGKDVKPGDELCYAYGSMRDDYAVAHYGFLPDLEDPPRLMQTDHHEFKAEDDGASIEQERFDGTPEQCAAEAARLQGILDKLNTWPMDKMVKPKGTDYVFDTYKELQVRRRNALKYEINRLRDIARKGEL